jgi:hypothetical protein
MDAVSLRVYRAWLALLAVCAIPLQAAAQTVARPPVVSNSRMTLSGQAGVTRTIALPFMNNFDNKGDWYVSWDRGGRRARPRAKTRRPPCRLRPR